MPVGQPVAADAIRIANVDGSGAQTYRIATSDERGLMWGVPDTVEDQEGRAGSLVSESWDEGWWLGLGHGSMSGRARPFASRGYLYAGSMDLTAYGMARLSPQVTTITTGLTGLSGPTYFIEAQSPNGSKFVYCLVANSARTALYAIKVAIGGTATTSEQAAATGTNLKAGRPDFFKSPVAAPAFYIPCGRYTNTFRKLTVTNAGADTITTPTNPLYAMSFARLEQETSGGGTVPVLAAAYGDSLEGHYVVLQPNNPMTATWPAGFQVGDSTADITDILPGPDGYLRVAKADGLLYAFDGAGNSYAIIGDENRISPDDDNGRGSASWGTNMLMPTASGLWLIEPSRADKVGPDSIPWNPAAVPNFTNEMRLRRHLEGAAAPGSPWGYFIYGGIYILAARWRGDLPGYGPFIWHNLVGAGAARGCLVDSQQQVWFRDGNNIKRLQVAADGSPQVASPRGWAVATFDFVLPETGLEDEQGNDLSSVTKQFHSVEVEIEGFTGYCYVQMRCSIDGGAFANLGNNFNTNGINTVYWTAGTSDTGRRIRLRLEVTTVAGYVPATTDPVVKRVVVRAFPLPKKSDLVRAVLVAQDDGQDPRPALSLRDDLKVHEGNLRQITPPGENPTFDAVIYKVGESVVFKRNGQPNFGVEVLMRKRDTS